MTTTGSMPPVPPDGDDRELLLRLGTLLRDTAPPADLVSRARSAFAFRTLDAELAELVYDSDVDGSGLGNDRGGLAVRRAAPGGERQLVFETAGGTLSLELTLTSAAGRRRIEGHVLPTGPVSVQLQHESAPTPVPVTTDPLGGFVVEDLAPGPVTVTCRRTGSAPVSSGWILLD